MSKYTFTQLLNTGIVIKLKLIIIYYDIKNNKYVEFNFDSNFNYNVKYGNWICFRTWY